MTHSSKKLPLLALLVLLTAPGAHAQTDADRGAIQGIISQQLEAFQHDDATAAFSFASPMIQHMFGSPENFMAMVGRGYPPVYRPRQKTFGPLETTNGELIQKVELVGPDGRSYTALYTMEQQPDATWKINGCRLVDSDKVDA